MWLLIATIYHIFSHIGYLSREKLQLGGAWKTLKTPTFYRKIPTFYCQIPSFFPTFFLKWFWMQEQTNTVINFIGTRKEGHNIFLHAKFLWTRTRHRIVIMASLGIGWNCFDMIRKPFFQKCTTNTVLRLIKQYNNLSIDPYKGAFRKNCKMQMRKWAQIPSYHSPFDKPFCSKKISPIRRCIKLLNSRALFAISPHWNPVRTVAQKTARRCYVSKLPIMV